MLKAENERLRDNLAFTSEQLKVVNTVNGERAYQSSVLSLRIRELSMMFPEIKEEIQNLRVHPSRAERVSRTSFGYEKHITTELRDSTVRDTVPVKVFSYTDPWYTVHGIAEDSVQSVSIAMRDTLVQVVYRGERENPWLWFLSRRKLQQRVSLKNPNAQVVFTEVIELQKMKGRKE